VHNPITIIKINGGDGGKLSLPDDIKYIIKYQPVAPNIKIGLFPSVPIVDPKSIKGVCDLPTKQQLVPAVTANEDFIAQLDKFNSHFDVVNKIKHLYSNKVDSMNSNIKTIKMHIARMHDIVSSLKTNPGDQGLRFEYSNRKQEIDKLSEEVNASQPDIAKKLSDYKTALADPLFNTISDTINDKVKALSKVINNIYGNPCYPQYTPRFNQFIEQINSRIKILIDKINSAFSYY
jgi:archaellum component FlaC